MLNDLCKVAFPFEQAGQSVAVLQAKNIMNIALAHIRINKQHPLTALPGDGRQIRRHQRFSAVLSGARNHHNAVLSFHHGEIQTGSQPAYRFNKHISRAIDGQERHIRGFVFPATRKRIFSAQLRFTPQPL